jgi:apolipoprotein N-acyltransferase
MLHYFLIAACGTIPAIVVRMKKPKSILLWGAAAAVMLAAVCCPSPSPGQAPGDEQAIAQLVAEIAAQQAKMVANQQAMEKKLAEVEESVRVARLWSARGGGSSRK